MLTNRTKSIGISCIIARKRLSLRLNRNYCKRNVEEIEFEVPFGKLAGKLWNKYNGTKPVICIHGWQGNT